MSKKRRLNAQQQINISDDDTDEQPTTTTTLTSDRSSQTCNKCHQPRTAKKIEVDGRVVTLTHAQVCRGTCTVDRCTHRSHRTRKHKKRMVTPKEQRDAILAGFKPPTDVEFKDVLQKKLQKDGIDINDLAAPAQLSWVIEAAKEYMVKSSNPPEPCFSSVPSSSPQSSSIPSSLVNSVVHLMESGGKLSALTSSSSSAKHKLQCNHCSFVYDHDMGITVNKVCSICSVGTVHVARVGAEMSPLVFCSAMEMMKRSSTLASLSPSTPTSTPTTSSSSNLRDQHSNVVELWPPGKNCDICRRITAIKHCTSCMSYLCGSNSCADKLHKTSVGCSDSDMVLISMTNGTRSGRTYTPVPKPTTPVKSATTEPINATTSPDLEKKHDDILDDILIDMEIDNNLPTLLPLQKQNAVDRATQTEDTTLTRVDVGVNTNHNMIFKPLTSRDLDEQVSQQPQPVSIHSKPTAKKPPPIHACNKENKPALDNIVTIE